MAHGSILVVDDEPGLLDVLEWELGSLGYDVFAVDSGSTAVAVLKETEFDAVISDVRMPGLSGIDVLRMSKQLCPDTEVIIATGFAEMETVVDCVRGGAFDFIQKPFNLPSVMATVERAVERRRLRASTQLYEASLAISANRDPQALPALITDTALKIFEADTVALWLPTKDGVYLAHRVMRAPSTIKLVGPEAVFALARRGKPVLVPTEASMPDLELTDGATGILYPLMAGERLTGVLTVGRFDPQRPFRRGDVERGSALASQVLLAIENVRLATQATANERLASIGQMAAGVAHEINNPVSYVLMSLEAATELVAEVAAGSAEAKTDLEESLRDALDGAGRIRDIVGDLKNMSRADTGRRRVDPNEVVRAAMRVAGAELKHCHQVNKELAEGLRVDVDSGRITQVLVNLMVNAAHAVAQQPQSRVSVKTWADGDKVKVSISDNGPGIAVENQHRIFEAFFTTKAPGVGTGLGLSISRDIARAHGGDVELTSAAGQGACFTLTLPAAPA
ncbi:MAG: response regulator [Archangiaceae bacterium]|nr:response regulator [Archangiaceae bacterium]